MPESKFYMKGVELNQSFLFDDKMFFFSKFLLLIVMQDTGKSNYLVQLYGLGQTELLCVCLIF